MNHTDDNSPEQLAAFRKMLYDASRPVGVFPPDEYPQEKEIPTRLRRRAGGAALEDPRVTLTLTEVDGVLRWTEGYGYARPGTGLRRARRAFGVEGRLIAPIDFEKLEPNKIGTYLEDLDAKLTPACNFKDPAQGLRQLVNGQWTNPGVKPASKGRILLFIHGTFSNSDMYVKELGQIKEGLDLLTKAQKNYDQVLGFDHPTLAVTPVLNALDLARITADTKAEIDVICHSRGGLVARWWLENYGAGSRGQTRVVLVGSPLAGTSLAAAPRLRAALDLLTNVGKVLETGSAMASTAFPFFTVVTGLLKLLVSAGSIVSNAPIIDAAVSIVPGFSAQALVSNNEELNRLNQTGAATPAYFAVTSDFRPKSPGWEFWKYFVKIGDRLKAAGADLVFDEPNDLVVDTASMTVLARAPKAISVQKLYDFGENDKVHHTVYFRQPETVKFIAESLEIK
jgi:pimeloyl-ACP methyl ester carboxylesterase